MAGVAQIHDPPARPQSLLHLAGLAILLANKIRRTVRPYDRPRPWSSREVDRSVQYVLDVVRNWEGGFREAGIEDWLPGRRVLEIGPGPDLGTGVVLLARGARSYTAVDRFPLAARTPETFYEALLARLTQEPQVDRAREAVRAFRGGRDDGPLRYRLLDRLDGAAPGGGGGADLCLSQAVLEHLEDPSALLRRVTDWCAEETLALHHVDAATHTPWIREADPLNILRYPEGLYRALSFPGSPNRWRMQGYVSCLEDLGWRILAVQPVHRLSERALARVRGAVARPFREMRDEELGVFSFRLVLRRGREAGDGFRAF